MAQQAIITDLNKCVGCLSCVVACKSENDVPIGKFWDTVVRVGPTPRYEGAQPPDVDMYFLPLGCQHCAEAPCVGVCPTGASFKNDNGVVEIDAETCIGCGLCVSACPYGARYVNEEIGTAQKCTLCVQKTDRGELPQCVAQCCARARFFGDLDEGFESFEGPGRVLEYNATYDDVHNARVKMLDCINEFTEDEYYHLPDAGNGPSFGYILRGKTWQGFQA